MKIISSYWNLGILLLLAGQGQFATPRIFYSTGYCLCRAQVNETGNGYVMFCDHLVNRQHMECAAKLLSTLPFDFREGMQVVIGGTNLDEMPREILPRHNVTDFVCYKCYLTRFTSDLCHGHLFELTIRESNFTRISLVAGSLSGCAQLKDLGLYKNGISEIQQGFFQGLDHLERLNLQENRLTTVPDFRDVEDTLLYLDLSKNTIRNLGSNAFQGMHQLENLDLSGNGITTIHDGAFDFLGPDVKVLMRGNSFYCDCSQAWLQQWVLEHPLPSPQQDTSFSEEDINLECRAPTRGPLKTLNFCDETKAQNQPKSNQESWSQNIENIFRWVFYVFQKI